MKPRQRIRQSPKLPAGERREQLLRAAHKLFVSQGYRATTMEQIARKAGLTKGAVYFHFTGKEDIMLAFVREIVLGYHAALAELTGKRLTPVQLLQKMRDIDCAMPLPEARQNLGLVAEVVLVPRFRKLIEDAYDHSVRLMTGALDPAFGRTVADRRRLVELTFALYDGINFSRLVHPGMGNFQRQLKTFARVTAQLSKRPSKEK